MRNPALVVLLACNAASAQSWPSVSTELPRAGGGESDTAVIVGVSDYFLLPDIPGAAANAADWHQYLVRVRGVPLERATLLVDGDATRENIEKALRGAAAAARPGGQVFFVFIGHGAPAPSGDDGVLLGVDTQPNADSLGARGVAQAQAAQLLAVGRQAGTVLIYDACFSGKTADAAHPLVSGLQATPPVRKAPPQAKAVVLSSSETFAGPLPGNVGGAQRPAFSYVLLGALRGWADTSNDRAVTVDEAYAFARGTLQAALKGSGRLPILRGPSDVVLARNIAERAPDVQAIVAGRCPDGMRWEGRHCAAVPCPGDTSWNGNDCAPAKLAVACPHGARWDGATCVANDVTCPAGAAWNGTDCVSKAPAPAASSGAGRFVATRSRVEISDVITFPPGSAVKIPPLGENTLRTVARVIKEYDLVVSVGCHHDDTLGERASLDVTRKRAELVRAFLIREGVAEDRVDAQGFGARMPVALNSSFEGKATNRRCEFKVH